MKILKKKKKGEKIACAARVLHFQTTYTANFDKSSIQELLGVNFTSGALLKSLRCIVSTHHRHQSIKKKKLCSNEKKSIQTRHFR